MNARTTINLSTDRGKPRRRSYFCSMYDSLVIANFFIKKSLKTGVPVSPMKLLKLVYISHGWHLGIVKKPLVAEACQAWKYGPVFERVYHRFKHFGASPITQYADINSDFQISGREVVPPSKEARELLEAVWEAYSVFSGIELSALTHQKGTPWYSTFHSKGEGSIIAEDDIMEYYEQRASAGDGA